MQILFLVDAEELIRDAGGLNELLGGLKDRVEALGGVLEVESPEGQGTRLMATFPLQ